MMNFKIVFFCLGIVFLTACSKESSPAKEASKQQMYFSLQGFFEAEIEKLQSQPIVLHKNAYLNEKVEKKALHEIDWATEFNSFVKSDINKPAWKDSYRTDSLTNRHGQFQINYTALDPDLRTQEIAISFGKGDAVKPVQIRIVNQSQNPIYDAVENLQYEVGKNYTIENEQKIMWMEGDKFKIKGEFFVHRGKK